jgi:hypothetical protein
MTKKDHVLLEIIAHEAWVSRNIRRSFPNAEERMERVGETFTEDCEWEEVRLQVFRCPFESISSARAAAARKISNSYRPCVTTNVSATPKLDERQVAALACYHVRHFLSADRALYGGKRTNHKPPRYDRLPWPPEQFGGSPNEHFCHHRCLVALESVLGLDDMRDICESMAAQPARASAGDFDVEYNFDDRVMGAPVDLAKGVLTREQE